MIAESLTPKPGIREHYRHDSDEPITAGYVRSWRRSGHADLALEMTLMTQKRHSFVLLACEIQQEWNKQKAREQDQTDDHEVTSPEWHRHWRQTLQVTVLLSHH
jgi:hypothetical protein